MAAFPRYIVQRNQLKLDIDFASIPEGDKGKLAACHAAVDKHIKDGQVVGIGSGSTVVYAVQRIAQRVRAEGLRLTCVPTSYQARELIREAGLPLSDISLHTELDVDIDGADELDIHTLDCIKGGGGCHVQEKIIAFNSKVFVVVADSSKLSDSLGTHWTRGVPIEVVPMAHAAVQRRLATLGGRGGLRMAKAKAGPVVTDNGNFILDLHFGELKGSLAPATLEQTIRMIPGVVDCGLFVGLASEAYLGAADGSVEHFARVPAPTA